MQPLAIVTGNFHKKGKSIIGLDVAYLWIERILSAGRNVPVIVVSSDDSEDEENEVEDLVLWED